MGLSLPPTEQVVFTNSPLTQVVCQVRVPAVLSVQEHPPAEFQELVRHEYPVVQRDQAVAIQEQPDADAPTPVLLPPLWHFASADTPWTVTLASDFVALESGAAYQTFDDFLARFRRVFQAYAQVYRPSLLDRVGLRYINELSSPPDAGREYWVQRLNPLYAGVLECAAIERGPVRSVHELRLSDREGQFTLRHAYVETGNGEPTKFVLDYDRYVSGPLGVENLDSLLQASNDYVFRAFLWSLTPKLRAELGQIPAGGQ